MPYNQGMDIKQLLDELLKAEGSKPILLARLGVSQRMFDMMRTGQRSPGVSVLRRIGKAYPGRRRDLEAFIFDCGDAPDVA